MSSENSVQQRIGLRIKELREEKNLTQRELAKLSGVPYTNIAKIELANYSVGLGVLEKIARALDCRIELV